MAELIILCAEINERNQLNSFIVITRYINILGICIFAPDMGVNSVHIRIERNTKSLITASPYKILNILRNYRVIFFVIFVNLFQHKC